MKHLKRKLMMTLALLLTAVTGAWAESKPIGLNVEYEAGDVITTNSTGEVYIWWGIYSKGGDPQEWVTKITSSVTPTISKLGIDESSGFITLDNDYAVYNMNGNIEANSYKIQCQGKVTGTTLEKVYVASGSGTLTDPYVFAPGAAASGNPFPITWSATTPNTASIDKMPAGNVTVSVEYFPQAEFAKSTDPTPVALAPTAIANVPANTDAPIVTAGTVANIGTSEVKQGTLMYFVSQSTGNTDPDAPTYTTEGWTDKVPTANGLKQGDAYVWYYIKGAEPANVADRTDDNTRSDSDIKPLGTDGYVTLAAEPTYDVTLNDEGLSTDEAAAWKVAKGTDQPAAFPLEGVKKSETVTVTYTGSKKIIGVKAEKKSAFITLDNTIAAWTAGTYVVPAGGLTYSDAITVSGDVTLVLTDGETLTLNKGISLASGATLTIQGNGTMNVNGTDGNTSSTVGGNHGTLVLTSGTLTAKGGNGGSGGNEDMGISGGNGGVAINGSVIVSGGTLTARGGNGGSVGNECLDCRGGNGGDAISGTLTINGGSTSVNNGSNGSIGSECDYCTAGKGGKAVAGTVTDNRN